MPAAQGQRTHSARTNLIFHEVNFGLPANWAFSATSHGKGPWDGVAGCAKREAALESLRRPEENQIQTAMDLYDFFKEKFRALQVEFISSDQISQLEDDILVERFKVAKTIKDTLGFHNFSSIPGNHQEVLVKKYSLSEEEGFSCDRLEKEVKADHKSSSGKYCIS